MHTYLYQLFPVGEAVYSAHAIGSTFNNGTVIDGICDHWEGVEQLLLVVRYSPDQWADRYGGR